MADLFKILNALSRGDIDYIRDLTDDELKDVEPYVLNMWISNPMEHKELRTYYTNLIVNPFIFKFPKHKKMLLTLMAISQQFGYTKYVFPKKAKAVKNKKTLEVVRKYYDVSASAAELYLGVLSERDVRELAEALGYQREFIKELEKEFK